MRFISDYNSEIILNRSIFAKVTAKVIMKIKLVRSIALGVQHTYTVVHKNVHVLFLQ